MTQKIPGVKTGIFWLNHAIFMIHYNIWFNLRSDFEPVKSLGVMQEFLRELYAAGSIAGFQILQNSGDVAKTRMLPYQALIEFNHDAQFSAAFSARAARGIHTGLHGRVMSLVGDFRIEVFRQIATSADSAAKLSLAQTPRRKRKGKSSERKSQ